MKDLFLLDHDTVFLNFGSFGACPKPILQKYQELQNLCESNPVRFITAIAPDMIEQSRMELGIYVDCDKDDLVLVTNPSYAVNAVAKNFELNAGDEVLATNIEYGACDRTWEYYCQKKGGRYVRQHIPLPLLSDEMFLHSLFEGVTPNTKLIFLSHITSSTALCLPVEKVIAKAKTLSIPTFIDGAHVPGHIPLSINQLGCDYYTGACHKWMMTPKGSSFLYVTKDRQADVDPLIISWGFKSLFPGKSQFIDYHQFNGTRDLTAFCTIPASIAFMKEHDWEIKARACKKLVHENADRFAKLLKTPLLAPIQSTYIPQMLSLQINTSQPEMLKQALYEKYKIEIPVMQQGDKNYIRFSIQVFNTQHDLDKLYNALEELLAI